MKSIFDAKIEEYNFELHNNLLTAMYNLFRWGKAESLYCIYCKDVDHGSIHLLIRCPHLENIWNIVNHLQKETTHPHPH